MTNVTEATVLVYEAPLYFSSMPRLIVRGPRGEPLAGRYCEVVDESSGSDWADVLTLEVSVEACGPSNADD